MPKLKISLIPLLSTFFITMYLVHYFTLFQCSSADKKLVNKQRYRLIVLVLSASGNSERRDTIRKTWLSEKPESEVKSFFSIGLKNMPQEEINTLESENKRHNDLLLLPKLLDTYATITKKVLQSLVYIYENYKFDFLLKVDDDSFAVIDQILRELFRWENKGTRAELYWGYFDGRARVKRNGPWRETDWFLCDHYLPYALGGGYILSYNLVKFIAENSEYLKLYNSEDVSVGLWLAPISNIERKHDVRFDTEYRSRGCSNQYLITHKQNSQSMRKLHEYYSRTGELCAQEIKNFLGYQYNWTVSPSRCCERKPGIP